VRRIPIAVLSAMVLTAVALKWRAHAREPHGPVTTAQPRGSEATERGIATMGLGAGPPAQEGDAGAGARGPRLIHGDPRHSHRSAARAPAGSPTLLWTRDVGGPVEAEVTVSPDERTLYAASLGGTLTALASDDGTVRWTLPLGDRVYATPCVADDGTIYVGGDGGKFLAVSPEGKTRWSLDTEGDADSGPAIAPDGSIVFAAGRSVYDVTPAGHVRWRFAAKRKVFTAPAIGPQGRIFFGSQDHHAYAVSLEGRLVWTVDLGADVDGAPAIGDQGALFVGTDGDEVVRLDPDDGHVVWRAALGGYVRGALSVARNGDVLAGVYGPRPREVRLRADDGGLRGDFPIQGTGARDFGVHGGALEDAAGTLVFGTQDDAVYAVDASGQTLWRFVTGGDVDAPVTLLGDGTLVIGSDDGLVRAVRAGK
jgi:outer membrane protein assembly factor BamB